MQGSAATPARASGTSLLLLDQGQADCQPAQAPLFLGGSFSEELVCCRVLAVTSGDSRVIPRLSQDICSTGPACENEMPCWACQTGTGNDTAGVTK